MLSSYFVRRNNRLKLALLLSLSLLVLWCTACDVTSINALYDGDNDPDLVFAPNLTGSWSLADEKCATVLTITKKGNAYEFRSIDQGKGCDDQTETRQLAHLMKLDGRYFIDVEPTNDQVCDRCLATHWIALAEFDDQRLAFTPIDSEGLGALIQTGVAEVSTLPADPNALIPEATRLTARSGDLKNFCRRFATDTSVFKPESTFAFERTQATTALGQSLPVTQSAAGD
jgi:hypothetical protein